MIGEAKEVKRAKATVREREQAIWAGREEVGRAARSADAMRAEQNASVAVVAAGGTDQQRAAKATPKRELSQDP